MTYQSYDLSRYIDGDLSQSNSITVSDHDTLNCAHMLVAGFNTMSRNFMGDFVLAVVDTKNGTVQYDGKIEKIDCTDKRRDMLESAYAELQAVKGVLFDAGVETIPADEGVRDVIAAKRIRDQHITRRDVENAAARAELIEYVKGERAKWLAADKRAPVNHEHMSAWFRGVLDVLAKFLVVTGEADADEGHAVARRLCGISDE